MSTLPTALSRLDITKAELGDFCRKNRIRKLALYGSALRGELGPNSDIDLLVEFEPDQEPTLIGFSNVELDLTDRLGRKIDLRTAEDLSRYFRDEVVTAAEVVYEKR